MSFGKSWENTGGKAPIETDSGTHRMWCFSAKQRRDGWPGLQDTKVSKSGPRLLGSGTAKEAGLGTRDQRSLTFPSPSCVGRHSGVYAVARGAGEELLEFPRADLLSMARNPRPSASVNAAATATSAGGEAVVAGE